MTNPMVEEKVEMVEEKLEMAEENKKDKAEEKKELGNKSFASGDYDAAIKHYTDAINVDRQNCVYFSNRSACHGGKRDWDAAASDATECVRLDPTFLKGYYRLAAARVEQGRHDAALAAVKSGLNVDPDNAQLAKQARTIKARRKAAKDADRAAKASKASGNADKPGLNPGGKRIDASVSDEVADLHAQLSSTAREFRIVQADINCAKREKRSAELTRAELDKMPDGEGKMYRGVGKMFVLSSRSDVNQKLDDTVKAEGKVESDLVAKADYLERRMKSQKQNIQELTKQ